MNEEMEPQTTETPQGGINSMMIIGAVIVLAIIGFFVIRSTSGSQQNAAMDDEATTETRITDDEGGSDALDDESMVGGDAMMTADQTKNADTMSDTAMEPVMDGDVQVISVEGGSFYYKPNTITVKKGQKVRIEMKSVDMMHDFVIDELDVKSEIAKSGDTAVVEFVADTVGEFEYYCSVGQHRANGMVGTLVVTE